MFEDSVLSWQFLSLRYEVHRTISDRTRPCAPFTSLSLVWRPSNADGQIALEVGLRLVEAATGTSSRLDPFWLCGTAIRQCLTPHPSLYPAMSWKMILLTRLSFYQPLLARLGIEGVSADNFRVGVLGGYKSP